MHELTLANQIIRIKYINSRNKRVKLSVTRLGELVVNCPNAKPTPEIWQFIQKNQDWVEKQLKKRQQKTHLQTDFLAQLSYQVPYLDGYLPVRLHTDSVTKYKISSVTGIDIYQPADASKEITYQLVGLAMKSIAKHYLTNRVAYWAKLTQSNVKAIKIKAQATRWGSCSSKGNLNFNWYCIFLSTELIDYLIIHELMHLREMNHSDRFWKQVESYCPDYQRLDKQLTASAWLVGLLD